MSFSSIIEVFVGNMGSSVFKGMDYSLEYLRFYELVIRLTTLTELISETKF